ncbi:pseudouridine synthase [Xanthobacter sp. TB0136]|uniref:pseudouridine synthase n=1 Tax=Xanthobacter sp. TB0136 TaxID=3459177 RepID=UPI00403A495A
MSRNLPPRKDKNRVPRQKRELPPAPKKEAERVAKVVARAGLASRREIEEWIAAGRVAVNGQVLETPAVTVTAADIITVDGAPLPERERTRLFLYHKPRGVVTTNKDPEGRTTLFELLPGGLPRLVSVGRLDLNSEGLLLLTNDGGLSRVLELPETGWLRRYRVRAHGDVDQARLDTLMKGISVEGIEYGPIEATLERMQGSNAWITVSLREGKNREVRNVLGALGLVVNRLIRISYGPFQLNDLPEGEIEEVRTRVLRDQIGEELAAAAGADFSGPLVERELEAAPPRPAVRTPERAARGPRERENMHEGAQRGAGPRERRRLSETNELESRGTVADRKGRTIKVERVVADRTAPVREPGRGPGSFRGERGGRDGFNAPARSHGAHRGEGARRGERFEDDRRGPGRSFGGPREDRPGREDFRRDRSRDERDGARGASRFDERSRFGAGRRSEGAEGRNRFGDRNRDERPAREDFRRERPRDARGDERGSRRFDERPRSGGSRGFEGSEGRNRFEDRPRAPRPAGERSERRFDERPRSGGSRGFEGSEGRNRFEDRPRGPRPAGDRFERGASSSRPHGRPAAGAGSYEKRGSGEKSFGDRSHAPRDGAERSFRSDSGYGKGRPGHGGSRSGGPAGGRGHGGGKSHSGDKGFGGRPGGGKGGGFKGGGRGPGHRPGGPRPKG